MSPLFLGRFFYPILDLGTLDSGERLLPFGLFVLSRGPDCHQHDFNNM